MENTRTGMSGSSVAPWMHAYPQTSMGATGMGRTRATALSSACCYREATRGLAGAVWGQVEPLSRANKMLWWMKSQEMRGHHGHCGLDSVASKGPQARLGSEGNTGRIAGPSGPASGKPLVHWALSSSHSLAGQEVGQSQSALQAEAGNTAHLTMHWSFRSHSQPKPFYFIS